jgi:hypothetical protein
MRRRPSSIQALCLGFGFCALGLAAGACGTPGVRTRDRQQVTGLSERYSLSVVGEEWHEVEAASLEEDVDLELVSDLGLTWLRVFVYSNDALADVVDRRRAGLFEEESVSTYHERRFFLPDHDRVAASEARYRVGGVLSSGVYVISTASIGDDVIELVGFVGSVDYIDERAHRIELMQRSLRLHDAGEQERSRREEPAE